MPLVSQQDSFHPDATLGSLQRPGGQRVAALGAEFIQALHVSLLEQFGDTAQDVLYRSGYEWGLREMVNCNAQLHARVGRGVDLWQMDAKFILDLWWTPFSEAGWGRSTFDVSILSRGFMFVELQDSAIASAFAGSDQPVCHLYAGLFAAAVSFFERTERHAVELQCSAVKGTTCTFVVAAGPQIDAAESWRQQGASAEEIIQRLR